MNPYKFINNMNSTIPLSIYDKVKLLLSEFFPIVISRILYHYSLPGHPIILNILKSF